MVHRLAGVEGFAPSSLPTPQTGIGNVSALPPTRDGLSRETGGKTPVRGLVEGEWVRPHREGNEFSPGVSAEVGHRIRGSESDEHLILAPSSAEPLPEIALPESGATGALALAKETARRGAREEAAAPEDLDALAAKIQLILDDQARRHGIDV
jgi:hypothetical protein